MDKESKTLRVLRRAPLTDRQKQFMLKVLARDESIFLAAYRQLKIEHFDQDHERVCALFWSVLSDAYTDLKQLPSEEYVAGEIEQRLDSDPDYLTEDEIAGIDELTMQAFASAKLTSGNKTAARKYLRVFMEDRLAVDMAAMFYNSGSVPVDMPQVIESLSERVAEIRMADQDQVGLAFPDNWAPDNFVQKTTTHLSFLDEFLNGGAANKEVYGVLGPYGSCKTTMAVQLSTHGARSELYSWWDRGGHKSDPLAHWFYASYEEPINPFILIRAVSFLGEIDRKRLEEAKGWDTLSTSDTLEAYERKMFRDLIRRGERVPGEAKRAQDAKDLLNMNWVPLDMTGFSVGGRGAGGVPELANRIRVALEERQQMGYYKPYVKGVVIDYVGAAVEQMVQSGKEEREHYRHLIGKFGFHVKHQIAGAFDCPVYTFHQLSGEANSLGSGVVQKQTSAAEAKNFAENLDFNFTLGTKTADSLCLLACTKARRAPIKKEVIVRIEGQFCRVVSTNDAFMLDQVSRKIISRSEYGRIHTVSTNNAVSTVSQQLDQSRDRR